MTLPSDAMLEYHLRYNHYPPQPVELIEPCRQAIAATEAGEPELLILLNRKVWVPASELVENLHLEGFVEQSDDWMFEDE